MGTARNRVVEHTPGPNPRIARTIGGLTWILSVNAQLVVHKRVGKSAAQMGEQFVTMTLSDFAVLLGADRNPYRPDAISEVVNRLENE